MRVSLVVAALAVAAGPAAAECYGTESFQTCRDSAGNTYSVQRFGSTTMVDGYNLSTGSRWNQTSHTFGNSTFTDGQASDGGTWNRTDQSIGDTTFFSGTDSDGNYFSGSCPLLGCD